MFNTVGVTPKTVMLHFIIMTNGIEKMGERIRALREMRWRSQEKFTEYMEDTFGKTIHQTSLSAFERGEKFPTVRNLALLARALETNADYLLGLTDDERPHADLDDQVVVTIEDEKERRLMQEAVEMLSKASSEDKEYILGLIRRLAPKRPRIIGGDSP